jgi:hypothetical protein
MERANPLPPNQRYWVDVAPGDALAFDAWLALNRGSVGVERVSAGDDGWQWILFRVNAPLVWWAGPGYPTIARDDEFTEADVKRVPTPEGPQEVFAGAVAEIAPWAVLAFVCAVVARRLLR